MRVMPLSDLLDRDRQRPALVDLLSEALAPYWHWLIGGTERTKTVIAEWTERDSSEFSASNVHVAVDDGVIAGAYIGLPRLRLERARKTDFLTLLAGVERHERPELQARLQASRSGFVPLDTDDFYLSALAVAATGRRRGVGRTLLEHCLVEAQASEATKVRLDVWEDNETARRFYDSCGFRQIAVEPLPLLGTSYVAMVRDLAT